MPSAAEPTSNGRSRRNGSLARLIGTRSAILKPPTPNIPVIRRSLAQVCQNASEVPARQPPTRSPNAAPVVPCRVRIQPARSASDVPSTRLRHKQLFDAARQVYRVLLNHQHREYPPAELDQQSDAVGGHQIECRERRRGNQARQK